MGATASGPTGAKDEYVVTYCRVRVCPPQSRSRATAPAVMGTADVGHALVTTRRFPPL